MEPCFNAQSQTRALSKLFTFNGIQDNCPVDFNPEQDERACEEVEEGNNSDRCLSHLYIPKINVIKFYIGFSGCTAEVDEIWSISWSDTFAGLYDTQNCSGGTIG